MDVFSVLNAMHQFSTLVDKPPVSLLTGQCVHDQHKHADCDLCLTACPTRAFDLVEGQITLAADHCVRCGYCIHACPTGAIAGQTESDALLKRIEDCADDAHIELACAYCSTPQTLADPKAALFITPRCLAALSVSTLVALANLGVTHVTLRTDVCRDCPIGQLAEQIHATAATAQPLVASQPAMTLNVCTHVPVDAPPVRMLHDTNHRAMSRRALFQMFTNASEAQAVQPEVPVDAANIPPERQRLLAALAQRPEDPPPWAPAFQVMGTCSACQVCTRICPTKALVIDMERTRFRLGFNAARCTDCGLCATACPEDVLHRDTALASAVPGKTTHTMLTSGPLRECKRCKTPFSGTSDLCPVCTFRRKNPFGSYLLTL